MKPKTIEEKVDAILEALEGDGLSGKEGLVSVVQKLVVQIQEPKTGIASRVASIEGRLNYAQGWLSGGRFVSTLIGAAIGGSIPLIISLFKK
jgi:hypothetical protein